MKILIVDDEPKIRKGLENYLMHGDLKFVAIETAENGKIALEKCRTLRPDIVLADIRMPKLGELEFIEEITCELEFIKIMIISGHDEFSYAQKAIKYGVCEYVLKPISLPNFDVLLRKVYNSVLEEKSQRQNFEFAMDLVDKSKDCIVSHFYGRAIRGIIPHEDVESKAASLGILIPDPAALIVLKIFETTANSHEEWDHELFGYATENIAAELCFQLPSLTVFTDHQRNLIILSAYVADLDYVELQSRVAQAIALHLGYFMRSAMTSIVKTPCNLQSGYKKLINELLSINEFSQIVIEAKNHIEQFYYHDDMTLQGVAEHMQVNPSYLSRLMHKQLGMSFVDYLTNVRMKKAVALISNCEKDIKLYEIAEKLGYNSHIIFVESLKSTMVFLQFNTG